MPKLDDLNIALLGSELDLFKFLEGLSFPFLGNLADLFSEFVQILLGRVELALGIVIAFPCLRLLGFLLVALIPVE